MTSTNGPADDGVRRPVGDASGSEGLWGQDWDDESEHEVDVNGPNGAGARTSGMLTRARLAVGLGVAAALGAGILVGALVFGGEAGLDPASARAGSSAGQPWAGNPAPGSSAGDDSAGGSPEGSSADGSSADGSSEDGSSADGSLADDSSADGSSADGSSADRNSAAGSSAGSDPASGGATTGTTALGAAATVPEAPAPVSIAVPDLGLDQSLIELGVTEDRTLEVPKEWMDIGWWATGPAPGEAGGAVIAGHVNGGGKPAVFAKLPSLAIGAEVVVTRADGSLATYVVRSKEQFPKDDFPNERMYTFEGPSFLHLVTCGGSFDTRSGHYDDNIVVFAELVGVTAA